MLKKKGIGGEQEKISKSTHLHKKKKKLKSSKNGKNIKKKNKIN